MDDLDEAYSGTQAAQSGHFALQETSRGYRAERLGALFSRFAQDPGPRLDELLDIYDLALAEALE